MPITPQEIHFDDGKKQAESLAHNIKAALDNDIATNGTAMLVLPGGSSPISLISRLAQMDIDWGRTSVTTTDERCVPLNDKHSNAGQIQRLFAEQGTDITPFVLWDNNAQHPRDISHLPWPASFIVLGMGDDGHTASLFPNDNWENITAPLLKATAPNAPQQRVSMSLLQLLTTRNLTLMVNGADKWDICTDVLSGKHSTLPVARLFDAARGTLKLYICA